jgi:type I restriction enzyme S subunit
MNGVWQELLLSEISEIGPSKAEARQTLGDADLVSFVPMECLGIGQQNLEPTTNRRLTDVAGSYTYFADGDVLLAKITPCFENGKLGIASGLTNRTGFGSSEYIVFRPHNMVTKEWMFHFLSRKTFRADGARSMTGAVGHKRVAKEFITNHRIPVPPSPSSSASSASLTKHSTPSPPLKPTPSATWRMRRRCLSGTLVLFSQTAVRTGPVPR